MYETFSFMVQQMDMRNAYKLGCSMDGWNAMLFENT